MALQEFDGGTRTSPPPRITPPRRTPPISRSSSRSRATPGGSTSSGSRYSGGGSSGSSRSGFGPAAPPRRSAPVTYSPPTPAAPSIAAYLAGDDAYQQTVRGGKRSLGDFLSEMQRRRGEAGTNFAQTKETMEKDRVTQLDKLRDEFASRGLIQSGLYGEEQGRFQDQFATQLRTLQQQQAGLLADLLSQERNYRREQELSLEVAKQEALARRAQRYRIGA